MIGTCPFVLSALNTLESTSVVTSGARITYSLTIRNDSLETISSITVSDSLAAKTSYIAGSATASPAIISFTGFPTSTSAFTLAGNSSVKITYAVQVGSVNSKEILLNTATVSSPGRSAVQAVHVAIVDPVKTYLPLILTDE